MKFDVDDKNRCRLVCVKFHLNRCRFAVAVAKCLGAHFFGDTVYNSYIQSSDRSTHDAYIGRWLCRSVSVAFLQFSPPVRYLPAKREELQHLVSELARFRSVQSRDRGIMRLCARIISRIISDLPHNWANPA